MKPIPHPTFGNGKVCYLEIPALDTERSARFYEQVFGWRLRRRGNGEIAFDDGVGEVSGTWVLGRNPLTVPGVLVHIMVDNVAGTLDAAVAGGGKVVEPINPNLREVIARFSDPAGNVFGLYQHLMPKK